MTSPKACLHGDPACPCPDGLACHYEQAGDSPPWHLIADEDVTFVDDNEPNGLDTWDF